MWDFITNVTNKIREHKMLRSCHDERNIGVLISVPDFHKWLEIESFTRNTLGQYHYQGHIIYPTTLLKQGEIKIVI